MIINSTIHTPRLIVWPPAVLLLKHPYYYQFKSDSHPKAHLLTLFLCCYSNIHYEYQLQPDSHLKAHWQTILLCCYSNIHNEYQLQPDSHPKAHWLTLFLCCYSNIYNEYQLQPDSHPNTHCLTSVCCSQILNGETTKLIRHTKLVNPKDWHHDLPKCSCLNHSCWNIQSLVDLLIISASFY